MFPRALLTKAPLYFAYAPNAQKNGAYPRDELREFIELRTFLQEKKALLPTEVERRVVSLRFLLINC